MKKLLLLFLPVLVLTGAGCSSDPINEDYDSPSYYYDDYYENSYDSYDYDSSYDSYSGIPQGYTDVYACDLDISYCSYVQVNIDGDQVTSVYTSYFIYPRESFCDSIGCYFIDDFGHEWYFDF